MTMMTYRQEMRRCEDPACARCREGAGHGPYWYAYYRDDRGRLCNRYYGQTPPPDLELAVEEMPLAYEEVDYAPQPLRLHTMGRFSIRRGETVLGERDLPRAGARGLLALLLLHPNGLLREEITGHLWPTLDAATAQSALRSALSALRLALEPPAHPDAPTPISQRLPPDSKRLMLHLQQDDWLDLRIFAAVHDPAALSLETLIETVKLYGGDLFPAFRTAPWTILARETLRRRWHVLSLHLARRLVEAGNMVMAITTLQRILRDDPTQEEATRLLLTLLHRQHEPEQGDQVYQNLIEALEHSFGVLPDAQTRAMMQRFGSKIKTVQPAPLELAASLRQRVHTLAAEEPGPEISRRLARLSAEHATALEQCNDSPAALAAVHSGQLMLGSYDFPSERSRLLLAEATIYYHQGYSRRAFEAATQAAQIACAADERALAGSAQRLQAQATDALGLIDEAIQFASASTEHFESVNAVEQSIRSRRILSFSLWKAGRFTEAMVLQRRNIEEAEEIAHLELQAYSHCNLGHSLLMQGTLDVARRHLQSALYLAAQINDQYLQLTTEYHLGGLWAAQSFLESLSRESEGKRSRDETRQHFARAMALAEEQDDDEMALNACCDLAVALAQWQEIDEARLLLQRAERLLKGFIDAGELRAWTAIAAAEIALADQMPDVALARMSAALPLIEAQVVPARAAAHRLIGCAMSARGEVRGAANHWQTALAAAVEGGLKVEELRTQQAMRQRGVSLPLGAAS